MKSIGVVRKVDKLGRIAIPIDLRRNLDIKEGDPLEFYTEGETVLLKSYRPSCIFCGEAEGTINFKGKNICKSCLKELKK